MGKKTRSIELRTGEGKLILSLFLIEHDGDAGERSEPPTKKQENTAETRKGNGQGNGGKSEELMSEAQRRYLFRILADQGIEGDAAYGHLQKAFGVTNLKDVSKQEASRAIGRLLEEAKGGDGDGPPF